MLLRAFVLGATLATVVGCSFRVDFAVVNTADIHAELTVTLASDGACLLDQAVFSTAPASELKPGWLKRRQPNWVPLDPSSFELNMSSCSFTSTLQAGRAMKVVEVYNHPAPENAKLSLLAVQRASIYWSSGASRYFSAEQLASQLVEARPRLWALFPAPEA